LILTLTDNLEGATCEDSVASRCKLMLNEGDVLGPAQVRAILFYSTHDAQKLDNNLYGDQTVPFQGMKKVCNALVIRQLNHRQSETKCCPLKNT